MRTTKSKSSPTPTKPITERGYPRLRHVSVPGYNKPTGTPAYVSKPASAAEQKAK